MNFWERCSEQELGRRKFRITLKAAGAGRKGEAE